MGRAGTHKAESCHDTRGEWRSRPAGAEDHQVWARGLKERKRGQNPDSEKAGRIGALGRFPMLFDPVPALTPVPCLLSCHLGGPGLPGGGWGGSFRSSLGKQQTAGPEDSHRRGWHCPACCPSLHTFLQDSTSTWRQNDCEKLEDVFVDGEELHQECIRHKVDLFQYDSELPLHLLPLHPQKQSHGTAVNTSQALRDAASQDGC